MFGPINNVNFTQEQKGELRDQCGCTAQGLVFSNLFTNTVREALQGQRKLVELFLHPGFIFPLKGVF